MLPHEEILSTCCEDAGTFFNSRDIECNHRGMIGEVCGQPPIKRSPRIELFSSGIDLIETFHLACVTGDLEAVEVLLDSGSLGDVNSEVCGFHGDENGKLTPLCCAASAGNVEVIQVLLEHGASLGGRPGNGGGRTALHVAVANEDNASCVAFLLRAGANPNTVDANGRTPLHSAANSNKKGATECMNLLLETGKVDMNAQDSHGYSALHLSAMCENAKSAALLLRKGCDVTLRTLEGTTALSMLERRLPETISHLVARLDSGVTLQNCDPADLNCQIKMDFSVLIPEATKGTFSGSASIKSSPTGSRKEIDLEAKKHSLFAEKKRCKETALLTCLVSTGNKKLLAHPLSEAFLLLKWRRVRKFFLTSLFFQMILVALFTIFVMEVYLKRCPYVRKGSPQEVININGEDTGTTEKSTSHQIYKRSPHPFQWFSLVPSSKPKTKMKEEQPEQEESEFPEFGTRMLTPKEPPAVAPIPPEDNVFKEQLEQNCSSTLPLQTIQLLLMITIAVMSLQEIFQLIHKPSKYFQSSENWIQWLLIISVLVTVYLRPDYTSKVDRGFRLEYWQYPAAACGILIAWTLTLFQVGRFPSFGLYMEMLTKVTSNFGLFIMAYACLLIAFALSFCILFPEYPPFSNLPLAILKVFTMMVGEVDYEELFYEEQRWSYDPVVFPITSHLLFGAFVLIMTIVLMNLLVGLAVNDIQGLQKGARLDRLCRQTELIARFESFLFSKKLETVIPTRLIRIIQASSLLSGDRSIDDVTHPDKYTYELSLCFRPNDTSDCTLPADIKEAALNLVTSPSRRQHTNQQDVKLNSGSMEYGKHGVTRSISRTGNHYDCNKCKSHSILKECKNDAGVTVADNMLSDNKVDVVTKLDKVEAKLATMEEGIDKILEMMTKMTEEKSDSGSSALRTFKSKCLKRMK